MILIEYENFILYETIHDPFLLSTCLYQVQYNGYSKNTEKLLLVYICFENLGTELWWLAYRQITKLGNGKDVLLTLFPV